MIHHQNFAVGHLRRVRRAVVAFVVIGSLASLTGCGEGSPESSSLSKPTSEGGQGSTEPSPAAAGAPRQSASASAATFGSQSRPAVRNVILISIDTLRADRLETFGYRQPTSPNLAALAQRSVVFDHAQSQAPQTAPSHASLFTSEYPGTHGIINVHGNHPSFPTLPAGLTTLAEVFQRAGHETAAFVCGGNLTKHMMMNRGFDAWDERNEDVKLRADALLRWLDRPHERPFLALLHTYQVHAPYVPPAELVPQFTDGSYNGPLRDRLERYLKLPPDQAWQGGVGEDYWEGMLDYTEADVRFLSGLYDAEIAHVDAELRRIISTVFLGPLASDTAIIIVADHGEEFRDHGKYQHDQTFEELIHVPLIVHLPVSLERSGWIGRVGVGVQLIDVAPTIADLAGLNWSGLGWEGRSLVPMLDPATREAASAQSIPRYSELVVMPGPKRYGCVTANGWKYTHIHQQDIDKTWESLFDLSSDPGESRNRIDEKSSEVTVILGKLRQLLAERRYANQRDSAASGAAGNAEMDEEARRALTALGYLQESGPQQTSPEVKAPVETAEPK